MADVFQTIKVVQTPGKPLQQQLIGAVSTATAALTLTLTDANTAGGGNTVYDGTITGGGANAYAGQTFLVSGFTIPANNGTFLCTASTATTLTLNNPSGVAETHAATAFRASPDAGKIVLLNASGQLDSSMGTGGGGGTTVSVNGSVVSNPNFQNSGTVTFTAGGSNVSATVIALSTTGSPVVINGAAPPTTGQVLTATSATTANWQTPGGSSLAAGIPIVTGAMINTSDNGWPGYTVWQWIRGSVITQHPTQFKIQMAFTAGTGVHIAACKILRTAPWSATVIDSTPVTFGAPTPLNVPFGGTATTTAPFFLTSDTISLTIDSNHDYYVAWFFDNDGTFNGSVGFNEWTPTSSSCGCPFIGFYQAGADQTGVSPIPNFPFPNSHVCDLLYAILSA